MAPKPTPKSMKVQKSKRASAVSRRRLSNNLDPLARITMVPELSVDSVGGLDKSMLMRFLKEPMFAQGTSLHTLRLHTDISLSSDATGSIANVINESPTSAPDWVNLANTFDKYRVIGFEVKFYPNNRYSKTTTTCTPVIVTVDRDDLAPLASYGQASESEGAVEKTLEDPWSYCASAQGSPSLDFRDCLSSTNTYFIKLFASGLSVSTVYGRLFVTTMVQFQGVSRG